MLDNIKLYGTWFVRIMFNINYITDNVSEQCESICYDSYVNIDTVDTVYMLSLLYVS